MRALVLLASLAAGGCSRNALLFQEHTERSNVDKGMCAGFYTGVQSYGWGEYKPCNVAPGTAQYPCADRALKDRFFAEKGRRFRCNCPDKCPCWKAHE